MSKNKELKELNPLSFSKSLEKPQFKSVISNLSARAKRVLNDLRIESIDDFLSLRSVDLERAWSCGKKTASEIKKLQDSLSKNIENEPPTNEPFAAIAPVSFENTPKDIFDSIQQQLNARSLNILEDLGITNLESFMRLNKKQLLKCRNCGRKTVNEIISMQEGIADYAQAIVDKFGEFKPRELLTAPCLFTVGSPGKNTLSTKDVFVDVDNPSNWLIEWVINLAKSENQAKAFMLRKGMLGSAPMTLEAVGEQVGGVTRERVRQMDMALEQAASSPLQQHRLLPIIKKLNEIVDQHGGFISLEELTHAALCKGKNGDQLRFAWDLIVFFSTLKVWIESGLEIKNTGIIRNRTSRIVISKLSKIFEKIVCSESDDFEDDCCWSIECGHLKATLLKKCSNIDGLQQIENVSDTLLDALINGFKGRVKLKNNRLYSKSLWHFRFGKITKFLDILLKKTEKPSHFTQIAQRARKWRPDLSDYNVHSTLDRMESAWLWDSGTFVHKDNVVIPFSLIHDVENWLIEALNSDTPFVSVNGAYINFQNRCKRANLPSEISLYTCLRQAANTDLLYPRLPFVYLRSGFTERVPVYVALERFIRDSGGPVSQQEVKNYCMEKIYLKEYQFYQVSQLVSNVIRTADWGYLHFDNVELNQESAAPLIQYTQEVLEKEGHCSIEKIYRDKIVTCRSIGINGPVMLYSVLQSFAGESLSMDRFPQLAKRNGAEQRYNYTIKDRVLDLIRDSNRPCHYQELEEKFVDQLRYKAHQVYSVALLKEVFLYHTGCLIHKQTLEWTEEKQQKLESIATYTYKEAERAGAYFGRISHIVESPNLPKLPDSLYWSPEMISDMLTKTGRYLVLGNKREAFLPKTNDQQLKNFEGLCGKLLNHFFEGAANLTHFEGFLVDEGVIKKRLTPSMLSPGEVVTIRKGEIILKELLEYAKTS